MKLKEITENYMSQKMRDAIISSKALHDRALPVAYDAPYEPTSGHTAIDAAANTVSQASGVPAKPRHRRFFGMETRPGTIRL
jgi:hypothetical protein